MTLTLVTGFDFSDMLGRDRRTGYSTRAMMAAQFLAMTGTRVLYVCRSAILSGTMATIFRETVLVPAVRHSATHSNSRWSFSYSLVEVGEQGFPHESVIFHGIENLERNLSILCGLPSVDVCIICDENDMNFEVIRKLTSMQINHQVCHFGIQTSTKFRSVDERLQMNDVSEKALKHFRQLDNDRKS